MPENIISLIQEMLSNNLGSYEDNRTKSYILHQINHFYLILNEVEKVNKGDDVS